MCGPSSEAISTTRCPTIPGATASCRSDFEKKMIERKWLGDKTGQGFYKQDGKGEAKEILALDWKTLEYHPAGEAALSRRWKRRATSKICGERLRTLLRCRRPRRPIPVEAVQRSVPLFGRDGSRDFGPHRRDRSRHALGLRQQAGAVRAVGCAGLRGRRNAHRKRSAGRFPENIKKMLSRAASLSLYRQAGQAHPGTRIFRFPYAMLTSRWSRAPALLCWRI